jgi:hypothetical protein
MAELLALQTQSAEQGRLLSLLFWAEYHEDAAPGGQLDIVFTELAKAFPDVICAKVGDQQGRVAPAPGRKLRSTAKLSCFRVLARSVNDCR